MGYQKMRLVFLYRPVIIIFALNAYYLSDAIVHTANGASELFYWNKKRSLYPTTGGRAPIARRPASGWLRK